MDSVPAHYREMLVNHLELCASSAHQLDYQRKVPIAHVAAELFEMWEDHYMACRDADLSHLMNAEQAQLLNEFDLELDAIGAMIPSRDIPTLDEFMQTAAWRRLVSSARDTLTKFRAAETHAR